jgi:hypothetical protein
MTTQLYGFYSVTQQYDNHKFFVYCIKDSSKQISCTEISYFNSEEEALKYIKNHDYKDMIFMGPIGEYINKVTLR